MARCFSDSSPNAVAINVDWVTADMETSATADETEGLLTSGAIQIKADSLGPIFKIDLNAFVNYVGENRRLCRFSQMLIALTLNGGNNDNEVG